MSKASDNYPNRYASLTMLLGKELIKPNNLKKPDFCVGSLEPKEFIFKCGGCQSKLSINFQTQINNGWGGKTQNITDQEVDTLKKYYALSKNSRAHGGGFPTFDLISCNSCKTQYYTYTGVDEFSNGAYAVFIQGVISKNEA